MGKKKATGTGKSANGKPAKRTVNRRQKKIEGTYDPVPTTVQRAADHYVLTMKNRTKVAKKLSDEVIEARDDCISQMMRNKVERVPIDDGSGKCVVHRIKDALKIEKSTEVPV